MAFLFQILVLYLLLLLTAFSVPKLQPLIYSGLFFVLFFLFLMTFFFPFIKDVFLILKLQDIPYFSLLIQTFVLYFLSYVLMEHIREAGFSSIAEIGHLSVKISILLLWLHEMKQLFPFLLNDN